MARRVFFRVLNFAVIYLVVSPLSNQPNLFACFASEHSSTWLPSKTRSSKLRGVPAVQVAEVWERWALGASLHLPGSSPALPWLGQVLSAHLGVHQALYPCILSVQPALYASRSSWWIWKSSWIIYAEHLPPRGRGGGQAESQNNTIKVLASKRPPAFLPSFPREAVHGPTTRKGAGWLCGKCKLQAPAEQLQWAQLRLGGWAEQSEQRRAGTWLAYWRPGVREGCVAFFHWPFDFSHSSRTPVRYLLSFISINTHMALHLLVRPLLCAHVALVPLTIREAGFK